MNDKYEQFLEKEYRNADAEPAYALIDEKLVLIPYSYIKQNPKEAEDKFIADFFQHNDAHFDRTIKDYGKRGEEPQFVWIDNVELPVPYKYKDYKPAEQRQILLDEADERYRNMIHRKILKTLKPNLKVPTITLKPGLLKKYGAPTAAAALLSIGSFSFFKSEKQNKIPENDLKKIEVFAPSFQADEGRFNRFMKHVFKAEGQKYSMVDQLTHTGIIQPTLDNYLEKHPEDRNRFPKKIKDLKPDQINKIYHLDYYKHYKIDRIRNEKTALMLFDCLVNHKYTTVKNFVKEACQETGSCGDTLNWYELPGLLNTKDDKELENIYNRVVQKRIKFMQNLPAGKFDKGLMKRANSFAGQFSGGEGPSTASFDLKLAQKMQRGR